MDLNPRAPRLIGDVESEMVREEKEEEEKVGRKDGMMPVGGGRGVMKREREREKV